MAFRLRQQESVADGLRRVAKKELRGARDELRRTSPLRDEAIHEARKSVKKLRAILQLMKAERGRGLGKSQKRLRSVNRTLSPLRDADAMMKMLTQLSSQNPHMLSEHTFARLRRQLLSRRHAAIEAVERDGAWKKTRQTLRQLQRDAKRWRPRHRGFGALAPGIRAAHRRGRRAAARARKDQQAADFHEWRKQIKVLWYELRLIERCGRNVAHDVRALHRAETLLGEEHNLAVLCAELSAEGSVCGPVELDRLRAAAARHQCTLRKKAIESAQRIYRRPTVDYVRTVRRAYKAWLRNGRAGRSRSPRRSAA